MAFLIINVRQKIAFYISDHSQVGRLVQAGFWHRGLTNDGYGIRDMLIDEGIL